MAFPLTKTLGTFENPLEHFPSLSSVITTKQHGNSNMLAASSDQQQLGTSHVPQPATFAAIVKSTIAVPRSEISLLYPNNPMPPVFKAGTFPHSVFYTLSASQSHLEIPLSKAIRERFPRGQSSQWF